MPTKPKLRSTPKDLPGHVIAAGGEPVEVRYLSAKRKPERVKARLLRAIGYPQFILLLETFEDEKLADLVCGQPEGWGATLHPESVQEIKAKAVELNFTGAQRWAETQLMLAEAGAETEKRFPNLAERLSSNGSTTSPSSSRTSSGRPSPE